MEKSPNYAAVAEEFEKRLGFYAYNHPKAKAAAHAAVNRLKTVLVRDATEDNPMYRSALSGMFGSNDKQSAGQIGTEFATIQAMLAQGNLREQMTAFYNAALIPFKQLVNDLIAGKQWGEAAQLGLDVKQLKNRNTQRDLFARDYGQVIGSGQASSLIGFGARAPRRPADQAAMTSERTAGDLAQTAQHAGAPLSDREKKLAFNAAPEADVSAQSLPWVEGGTKWKVDQSKWWFNKIHNKLGMPVVSGPSGTTERLFDVYKWIRLQSVVPPEDFRLALLGWMMTSHDHSFHEIMSMAATKGLGLDYQPGPEAYRNIRPLTLIELRSNVGTNRMFPDELVYGQKTAQGTFDLSRTYNMDALGDVTQPKPGDTAEKLEWKKQINARLGASGAAALRAYTREGYLVMNPMMKTMPTFIKKQIIKHQIKKKLELGVIQNQIEEGDTTLEQVMKEAKTHIRMMNRTLKEMPAWHGQAFRGGSIVSRWAWRKGSTQKFSAFTSTSTARAIASRFIQHNAISTGALFELTLTDGRDLGEINQADEAEILLMPGATFKVTQDPEWVSNQDYWHIRMTQTGGGQPPMNIGEAPALPGTEDDQPAAPPPVAAQHGEADAAEPQPAAQQGELGTGEPQPAAPQAATLTELDNTVMGLFSTGKGMGAWLSEDALPSIGVTKEQLRGLSPQGRQALFTHLGLSLEMVNAREDLHDLFFVPQQATTSAELAAQVPQPEALATAEPKASEADTVCHSCGQQPGEGKFCGQCGAPQVKACPSCGEQLPQTAKFCSSCGAQVAEPAAEPPAAVEKQPEPPEVSEQDFTDPNVEAEVRDAAHGQMSHLDELTYNFGVRPIGFEQAAKVPGGKFTGYFKAEKAAIGKDQRINAFSLNDQNANIVNRSLATYRLDQLLHADVIPPTFKAEHQGQVGVLMEKVNGVLGENASYKDMNNPLVRQALSKLYLLDIIAGQIDRHDRNWLVVKEDGVIKGVKGIDNDLSFGEGYDTHTYTEHEGMAQSGIVMFRGVLGKMVNDLNEIDEPFAQSIIRLAEQVQGNSKWLVLAFGDLLTMGEITAIGQRLQALANFLRPLMGKPNGKMKTVWK